MPVKTSIGTASKVVLLKEVTLISSMQPTGTEYIGSKFP